MDIIKRSVIVTIIITVILNCANCFAMAAFTENKKMYVISEKIPQNDYIIEGYNWSECISMYMDTSKISIEVIYIEDLADDKDYNEFLNKINKDDIVLIQTGELYRDAKKEDIENIDKQEENEEKYVSDIKNKGAVTVVVLPSCVSSVESYNLNKYCELYKEMCKRVAQNKEVYFIEVADQLRLDRLFGSSENDQKAKGMFAYIQDNNNCSYVPNYCFSNVNANIIATQLQNIEEIKSYVAEYPDEMLPQITREEFVKQILVIAGENEEKNGGTVFNDVLNENEYYGYISRAKSMGIIVGDNNNCFRPNESIGISDACIIADRLLQKNGIYLAENESEFYIGFEREFYKHHVKNYKEYGEESISKFWDTVKIGFSLENFKLPAIYGIYYIVYDELN